MYYPYAGDLLGALDPLRRSSLTDKPPKPDERNEKGSLRPSPPLAALWFGYGSAELKAASAERLSNAFECMPPLGAY